jgi:AcrR family transcriptional regulator
MMMESMTESVKPRAYHSPQRAEKARQTRARVLTCARQLFLERGYPKTTLAAVGAEAGVASDTVLHLFGSKRGLLKEVMDTVVGGDDEDVALLDRHDPQALRAESDQHRQVSMFAAGMTAQLERIRPMDDILRSAAAVDQDAAALRDDLQLRQRRTAMTVIAGWIAANGPLLAGRTVEDASAMIWAMSSPEVHRLFRVDCGWSPRAYQDWLELTLRRTLLP